MNEDILDSCHDAILDTFLLDKKNLKLNIELLNKSRALIDIEGVERMRCEGLELKNIILEAYISNDSTWNHVLLSKLFGVSKHPINGRVKNEMESIQKKEKHLLHITPSFGVELIVLCRKIGISYL